MKYAISFSNGYGSSTLKIKSNEVLKFLQRFVFMMGVLAIIFLIPHLLELLSDNFSGQAVALFGLIFSLGLLALIVIFVMIRIRKK